MKITNIDIIMCKTANIGKSRCRNMVINTAKLVNNRRQHIIISWILYHFLKSYFSQVWNFRNSVAHQEACSFKMINKKVIIRVFSCTVNLSISYLLDNCLQSGYFHLKKPEYLRGKNRKPSSLSKYWHMLTII
jgi:hypothetical protein